MQLVGIDIGEYQVQMVHMADGKVKKAITAELPDNMVENGTVRSMDAMADFLRTTAKENGIPRTAAAVVLPEELVFCRNATLPVMTASQLMYNLPYEFKDYLSLEKEKYFYDYAVFGTHQGTDGQSQEMELFACAVLKSTVAEYRAMLRRAGFKLKVAVPEQWAYVGALRKYGLDKGTVCLVDLGHRSTRIHVFSDGRPDSRRSVDIGIRDLDRALAEEFHVDVHMARTYRMSNYNDCLASEPVQAVYGRLGVEILKTVNFYNYNHREQSLEQICLIGGGAAIGALQEAIASITNLQVKNLQDLNPNLKGQEPYLKAIGSALGQ